MIFSFQNRFRFLNFFIFFFDFLCIWMTMSPIIHTHIAGFINFFFYGIFRSWRLFVCLFGWMFECLSRKKERKKNSNFQFVSLLVCVWLWRTWLPLLSPFPPPFSLHHHNLDQTERISEKFSRKIHTVR